jgi:hypothetical protein
MIGWVRIWWWVFNGQSMSCGDACGRRMYKDEDVKRKKDARTGVQNDFNIIIQI